MHRPARILLTVAIGIALAACKPSATPAADAGATPAAPASQVAAAAPVAAPAMVSDNAAATVRAAIDRFMQVHSYHAVMQIEGGAGASTGIRPELDFVAPDRYRFLTPMGSQVIVGDTMYMQMHDRRMAVPMPKGTLSQWRDPVRLAQSEAQMTVRADGSETIDGVATQRFQIHNEQPKPSDMTLWLGPDGLPLQIKVVRPAGSHIGTSTVHYSHYNDPAIQIEPPR